LTDIVYVAINSHTIRRVPHRVFRMGNEFRGRLTWRQWGARQGRPPLERKGEAMAETLNGAVGVEGSGAEAAAGEGRAAGVQAAGGPSLSLHVTRLKSMRVRTGCRAGYCSGDTIYQTSGPHDQS
jgi:hypothetical protein